jgi:hypothetical protein
MNCGRSIIACLLLVVLTSWSGCSGPAVANRVEGMQRELRYHEDLIYHLDYENEWLCVENQRLKERLARCQGELEQAKIRPDAPPRKPRFLGDLKLTPQSEIEDGPPIVPKASVNEQTPRKTRPNNSAATEEDKPPRETIPKGRTASPPAEENDTEVEIGPATPRNGTKPKKDPFKDDEVQPGGVRRPSNPARSLPGARNPADDGARARTIPRKIMHSRVSPRGLRVIAAGSHGIDTDGQPGDDAIALVIEPVDREGEFVDAVGTLRVMVTDPAHVGAHAHVVTRSFTADQLLDGAAVDPSSNGYRIEIPINEKTPRHDKLRVTMVLYTKDGQELDTATDVIIRRQTVEDVATRVSQPREATTEQVQTVSYEHESDGDEWSARPKSRQQPITDRETKPHQRESRKSSSIAIEPIANKPNRREADVREADNEPTPAEASKPQRERPTWSPNR